MPALILYLLKINIALILFYLAYRFALRKLTFYTLNRFFLISGIIFSSAYPFIDVSDIFRKHTEINSKLIVIVPDWTSVQQVVMPAAAFDYWQLITLIFWTGVTIMAIRLLIQFISLYLIHRSSKPEAFNNYSFRKVGKEINPFSFWKSTYLNPSLYQKEELTAILQHEKIHADEWHTLDVLLAELSIVFYWFNPGVWLMKQAIKENLEFITDRRVLNSGLDSKSYQYSLVRMIFYPESHSLVNNFSFISVKKRIMMMNKKQSSQAQISRYLLIVPMVILLTMVFTVSKAQLENKSLNVLKKTGMTAIKNAVSSVNSIPAVITEATKSLVTVNEPVETEVISNEIEIRESSSETSVADRPVALDTPVIRISRIRSSSAFGPNDPLFVVDGVITLNALSALNPEDIYSMDVFRDAYALTNTIYANKAGNGVVMIVTKSGKYTLFNLAKYGSRPVLINGKEAGQQQIEQLSIDYISDINLIIDLETLKKYGDKGANGVVSVKTRNNSSSDDVVKKGNGVIRIITK